MPEAKVRMKVRDAGTSVSIIDIQGEVTSQAENMLADAFAKASTYARAVILNFSGLDYMNSSGIGLLVTLLIRAQRQQIRLMAYGMSEHYQQIFELTRLNEAIALFPTEPEALASLNTTRA